MKRQTKISKIYKKQEEVCKQNTQKADQCCTEKQLKADFLLRHRVKYSNPKCQSAQVTKQLKKMDSNLLQCPLCLDLIVHSVVTSCNHTFCEACLFEAFKNKAECPLCRKGLLNEALFFNAKSLDGFIASSMESLNVERKDEQAYKERVQQSEKQRAARQVKNVEKGATVILMCTDKRWREGQVVSVIDTENDQQITIEYKIKGDSTKDTVPSHSFRIVKKDFLKKQEIYDENSSDDDDPLRILSFFSILPFLQFPRSHFITLYLVDHEDSSQNPPQNEEFE